MRLLAQRRKVPQARQQIRKVFVATRFQGAAAGQVLQRARGSTGVGIFSAVRKRVGRVRELEEEDGEEEEMEEMEEESGTIIKCCRDNTLHDTFI